MWPPPLTRRWDRSRRQLPWAVRAARWSRSPIPAHPANTEAFLICAVVGLPVTKGSPCPGLFAHSHTPHPASRCCCAAPPVPAAEGQEQLSKAAPETPCRRSFPRANCFWLPPLTSEGSGSAGAMPSCPGDHPGVTSRHTRWHSYQLPALSKHLGKSKGDGSVA